MADGGIATHEWDAETIARERRPDVYLAEIDHSLATTFLSEPIYARLKSCYVGPMRIIEMEASARRSERTTALIARDRHDGVSVQLAVAGSASGEAAGRRVASTPGTIMLLDFAQPFHIVDRESRTVVNAAVPRAMLTNHFGDVRQLHGRVLDPDTGGLLAAFLRELPAHAARMPAHATPVVCEMIVDLLLLALGRDPTEVVPPVAGRRDLLLERAKRLVDGRLGSKDLTPEWLLAKLNVSRSELYAAFDGAGGIARFIWRRRLEAAQAALLDAHDVRRIGEIAFAFGFSSEAHFARAFRTAFGRTASATRQSRVPI